MYNHVEQKVRPIDEYEKYYDLQKTIKREEEQKISSSNTFVPSIDSKL